MRQGQQHRRGRGRNNNNNNSNHSNHSSHNNHRRGQNPLSRSFESNGPEVKVRGTPVHIAEKYLSLARDAQSSGDPVLAENYLQHAEHYNRIIMAYREQQIQQSGEAMNGNGAAHAPGRSAGWRGRRGRKRTTETTRARASSRRCRAFSRSSRASKSSRARTSSAARRGVRIAGRSSSASATA